MLLHRIRTETSALLGACIFHEQSGYSVILVASHKLYICEDQVGDCDGHVSSNSIHSPTTYRRFDIEPKERGRSGMPLLLLSV